MNKKSTYMDDLQILLILSFADTKPTIMFIIFWDFLWLIKFSFHRKWNKASLLKIHWYIRVASQVAKQLKT